MTIEFECRDIELARETPEDKHRAALDLAQLGPGSSGLVVANSTPVFAASFFRAISNLERAQV